MLCSVTLSGKVRTWATSFGTHTSSTRRLGSGEMTVRPLKSTRLPDRLPLNRPCLPFRRCTKPLHAAHHSSMCASRCHCIVHRECRPAPSRRKGEGGGLLTVKRQFTTEPETADSGKQELLRHAAQLMLSILHNLLAHLNSRDRLHAHQSRYGPHLYPSRYTAAASYLWPWQSSKNTESGV